MADITGPGQSWLLKILSTYVSIQSMSTDTNIKWTRGQLRFVNHPLVQPLVLYASAWAAAGSHRVGAGACLLYYMLKWSDPLIIWDDSDVAKFSLTQDDKEWHRLGILAYAIKYIREWRGGRGAKPAPLERTPRTLRRAKRATARDVFCRFNM